MNIFNHLTETISMAQKKTLRIGLIGCGFMGRTHSNGYNRIKNFFPELAIRASIESGVFAQCR